MCHSTSAFYTASPLSYRTSTLIMWKLTKIRTSCPAQIMLVVSSSNAVSVQYRFLEKLSSSLCSHYLSFSIFCQLFLLFLMSSSTWMYHFVLGHPICFFSSDFDSKALCSVLVISILFTLPDHCNNFSSNHINKFWIPTWLKIHFLTLSLLKRKKYASSLLQFLHRCIKTSGCDSM